MTRLQKELDGIIDSILFPNRFATAHQKAATYPPYNIIKLSDTKAVLELAVAGFKEEDISITVDENNLKISASIQKSPEDPEINYIYKGIGTRAFEKTFSLATDTKVESAEYADGILSVFFVYEIPEEKKPKPIPISRGERLYLTE